MIDGFIFLTELALVALLVALAYRMASLVRTEPFLQGATGVLADESLLLSPAGSPGGPGQPDATRLVPAATVDRTELFSQLHILMGLQERDCRKQGLDWQTAPQEVSTYAVAWLYGAACALCDKSLRHTGTLQGVVAQIASRKTPLRQSEVVQTLTTLTCNNTWLACFRHGLEGAAYWREHRFVPAPDGLYDAITNNAFI
ncbi:MAG: hypothetical protein ACQEV6_06320 [Pseudomonadota bacterium]